MQKQMILLHVGLHYILQMNILLSVSDSDFYQLITDKVTQFNGITDNLITLEGIYDAKGKQVIDKKTKEPKLLGDPEYLLFEKCMRGDSSDNVFSALSWCT